MSRHALQGDPPFCYGNMTTFFDSDWTKEMSMNFAIEVTREGKATAQQYLVPESIQYYK